jgi:hypothetical protein
MTLFVSIRLSLGQRIVQRKYRDMGALHGIRDRQDAARKSAENGFIT